MEQPIISVEELGKRYRIGVREPKESGGLRSLVLAASSPLSYLSQTLRAATEQETLWAIRNLTFHVNPGEVLGIIGSNGAGKSTLLKILSRITDPTEGRAVLHGRVGSLLEVGTGFHPDLTGRENIYLKGSLLGMKRLEIDRKLEEIVEFSEIGRFLDTPVKRYSSGMGVRLGFAVAAHLDPEILIVDEVLAVGDQAFQLKCLAKMEKISRDGRTILFVSHNMAAMSSLCHRILWLSHGKIIESGTPGKVISSYVRETTPPIEGNQRIADDRERGYFLIRPPKEVSFVIGEPICFQYDVECPTDFENACSGLVIYDSLGHPVVGLSSTRQRICGVGKGKRWHIECDLGHLPLTNDRYSITIWFGDEKDDYARFPRSLVLNIAPGDPFGRGLEVPTLWGRLYWKANWTFNPAEQS